MATATHSTHDSQRGTDVRARLAAIDRELADLATELVPEWIPRHVVVRVVALLGRIERRAGGARLVLSDAAAGTGEWRAAGARSPEEHAARQNGTSVGEAKADLRASGQLANLPAARDAAVSGDLSAAKAKAVADGATADPDAERSLLDTATKGDLQDVRDEARRVRQRVDERDGRAAERMYRRRSLKTWLTLDGEGQGHWNVPPEYQAWFLAALEPYRDEAFRAARQSGLRPPPEALMADALYLLARDVLADLDLPTPPPPPHRPDPGNASANEPGAKSGGTPTPDRDAPGDEAGAASSSEAGPAREPDDGAAHPAAGRRTPPVGRPDGGPEASISLDEAGADPDGGPGAPPGAESTVSPDEAGADRDVGPGAQPAVRLDAAGSDPGGRSDGGPGALRAAGADDGRDGQPAGRPTTCEPQRDDRATHHDDTSQSSSPSRSSAPPDGPPPNRRTRRLGGRRGPGGNRRAPAQIIVHVDYSALSRGFSVEGETCDIVGIGPVPVALVRHMAADAILRVVLTGTDVTVINSHRRYIPAALRRALEARDPECVVPSCHVRHHLEIDHTHDFALGGPTSLANTARLCKAHHDLKTYCGWKLMGGPDAWHLQPP